MPELFTKQSKQLFPEAPRGQCLQFHFLWWSHCPLCGHLLSTPWPPSVHRQVASAPVPASSRNSGTSEGTWHRSTGSPVHRYCLPAIVFYGFQKTLHCSKVGREKHECSKAPGFGGVTKDTLKLRDCVFQYPSPALPVTGTQAAKIAFGCHGFYRILTGL